MNLTELYQKTPREKHTNIRVAGNRVYVRKDDGSVEEYLVEGDRGLWLLPSPLSEVASQVKEMQRTLAQMEAKLQKV